MVRITLAKQHERLTYLTPFFAPRLACKFYRKYPDVPGVGVLGLPTENFPIELGEVPTWLKIQRYANLCDLIH